MLWPMLENLHYVLYLYVAMSLCDIDITNIHTIAQHVHKKENGNKNKLVDKRTRQGCKQHYHMINKHVNNNSITIIILNEDLSL